MVCDKVADFLLSCWGVELSPRFNDDGDDDDGVTGFDIEFDLLELVSPLDLKVVHWEKNRKL